MPRNSAAMGDFVRRCCKTRCWVFALALIAQGAAPVRAAEVCEPAVGRFVSVEGSVEIRRSGQEPWRTGTLDEPLCQGDTIRVGKRSRVAVALINDAVLRLDEGTSMRLLDITANKEERSLLDLIVGAFQSFSRAPRRLAVDTPYANGLVEGTEFVMRVEASQSSITVFEGKVAVSNDFGRLLVAGGESAIAHQGKAPEPRVVVRPRDAAQWALYYPPVLSVLGGQAGGAASDVPPALQGTLEAAARGNTAGALAALERTPTLDRNAQYYSYRAALLLDVGRVDKARADIDAALKRDPKAGLAYALRSIIEVVQNQREEALIDAGRAVEFSPSAASRIALSYAQQADFRIEAARDTLLAAVEQHPDDALAWARLGELWLMLGERDNAREAAGQAAALSPDLGRTQLVLGYAALAEFDNDAARSAFKRAIELSSADPLAHLGLGLAKISDGDLAEGRQEIEIAVGLDANSALLRSYLGKGYFEEKRDPLDAEQYGIAKELDPADPTPYLYDGIRKQTLNRPIEALRDLETSVALNDNRAVYRSRLLLDKDRASRGTTLSRVHKDLGFSQLGVNEATASLAIDPSNASAHRFLSDIYLGVRRREIARVSELLQAQLLQDVNINPVQPSVSETNLNIVTIGGPATPGFNEFTPLFERNTARLDLTAFAGNNSTYGGEGVVSSLYRRFSLSAGGFYYNSDGWRDNNDLNQHIYNIFAQAAITQEFNVQAEYRRRGSEEGDLAFNFNRDDFIRDRTIDRDLETARLGLRYSPTPRSNVLFSYIHSNREEQSAQTEFPDPFKTVSTSSQANDDGDQFEGQYIYQRDRFNLVAGLGYSDVDRQSRNRILVTDTNLGPIFTVDDPSNDQVKHPRGYVYTSINFPASVGWTVGFSYDHYVDEPIEQASFNPKFGVQWDVTNEFRLRAAVFKTLKPALVNNRTIEPTQIAGFNQFFDDVNGTESSRCGGGFDWRPMREVWLGGEVSWRDLDEPLLNVDLDTGVETAEFEDRDEQFHNLYLFWTPLDQLGIKAEFVYDRYDSEQGRSTSSDNLPEEVETISVPIGVTYFHPSGAFAAVGGTFVDQEVERSPSATQADGRDSFFLVDTAVGYRLPKRLGIVSVGVRNLFDIEFKYQDDSYREFRDEPSAGPYFPDRTLLARITLNF